MNSWAEKLAEAAMAEDEQKTRDTLMGALQHYNGKLMDIVNSTPATDTFLLIFVMRAILRGLETQDPDAVEIADEIEKITTCVVIDGNAIRNAAYKPEEE